MKRYVIGDIHGCYDELKELYDKIVQHADLDAFKIIFVGDYVDRGPDSKKVVDFIRNIQKSGHVALMGNHEDMILAGDFTYAAETIVSFGGFRGHLIPEDVLNWMRSLPKYYEDDTILVAHAAMNPLVSIEDQSDKILLWYRYPHHETADLPKYFYHGHTPMRGKIEQAADRTNVDTACVYGGHLTAAIVGSDGKPEGFIQVPKKGGAYDMTDAKARGWEI
jgi:serine/threonine protein phosphatase 1